MQALDIFGAVISSCWDMLAFTVPGLGVSCQAFVAALLLINVSVAVVRVTFGFGRDGTGYRSGSGGKKRISDRRKDDQF